MRIQLLHSARRRAAYSLVEVLAAAGIIAIGVGAALSLSLATVGQEEAGHRTSRAINIGENAARLYQLGLSPAEIIRLLPPDPVISTIVITEDTPSVDGVVTMQRASIAITFYTSRSDAVWLAGTWSGGPGGTASRRILPIITALRPTARAGY